MAKTQIGIPKGTRDFGPENMIRRNFIFGHIKTVFQKFGYLPLETPSMENLSVLTGKYGDEGDQLLFKVLNSGDYLSKVNPDDLQAGDFKGLLPYIAEKGLRYDLTVPFARYVAMNRNDVNFPFKRYQIQPVWRADRPQRGRYREFYQCDADVVGTDSLICEAEIILMINEVFDKLGISDFSIKVNNRKILIGITEAIGAQGKESAFCVAIDKLDKIGKDAVKKELGERGFSEESLQKLEPFLALAGNSEEKAVALAQIFENSETGRQGLQEMQQIFVYAQLLHEGKKNIDFDITLARGLSYYTGTIFEVKVNNIQIGSVAGGGRYDDLTGVFGLPGVSGVGISFGVDRLYDVMEELQLFPQNQLETTKVMIANLGADAESYALGLLSRLRKKGINSEIYPESAKLKKQLNYADKKAIPFVILIGPEEINSGKFALKNMKSGEQQALTHDEILLALSASK